MGKRIDKIVRAVRRWAPKLTTLRTILIGSLSVMATCLGIILTRLYQVLSGTPSPALLKDWVEWTFILLLGVVLILPLLHVLLGLRSENDRRTTIDDRSASADAIRFRRRTDRVVIESADSVLITWDLELEANPDAAIMNVEFPMEFEIGRLTHKFAAPPGSPDHGVDLAVLCSQGLLDQYRDCIKLETLTVDGANMKPGREVEYRQIRLDVDDKPETPSMVFATVDLPVNLGKGDDTSRVVLTVSTNGAFPRLLTGYEALMVRVPFLTRELIVEVGAGEDFGKQYELELVPGPGVKQVATAESFYLRWPDQAEASRVVDAVQSRVKDLRIRLDYPKTGYQYSVYFRAVPRPTPQRATVPPPPPATS